jgi:SAM-dependent methyltransferase
MKERNPQAEQMADESMLRNLAAQADAIWPQEQRLFERYSLPASARIADIGCGSGEITSRLAARYPDAELVGVDILEGSVAYARRRYAALAPRVRFEQGDAFELQFVAGQFDLVVCRHMTQSVPEPQRVLAELRRICRPGGWVHVLSEDYGMIHAAAGKVDPDRLWHEGVIAFAHATGSDARVGRSTWSLMKQLGLEDLHVDYIVLDTIRVPRDVQRDHRGVARRLYGSAGATYQAGCGRSARAVRRRRDRDWRSGPIRGLAHPHRQWQNAARIVGLKPDLQVR